MSDYLKISKELGFILLLFASLCIVAFSEDTDPIDSATTEIGIISADTSSPAVSADEATPTENTDTTDSVTTEIGIISADTSADTSSSTADDDEANPAEDTGLIDSEVTEISITSADTSTPTAMVDKANPTENNDPVDRRVHSNPFENADTADRNGHSDSKGGIRIIPPNHRIGGLSYGEWNAEWWKWAFSMPVDANPLFDTADCSTGQLKNVYFIGSSFTSVPGENGEFVTNVDRECTIPPGTRLFIPIFNVEASTAEGNGNTEEQLAAFADEQLGYVTDMSVEIDGVPIENLEQYESESPLFVFGPLPNDNVLQFLYPPGTPNINQEDIKEGATSDSVANGYYLMLAPLRIGEHEIHYTATYMNPDTGFTWTQDVTYTITVQPDKHE